MRRVKIDPSGCWLWTGARNESGYGQTVWRPYSVVRAHRISHALFVGPVPPDLFVLHSCDVKRCVRPEHLRIGTHAENMQDARERGRMAFKLSASDIADIRAKRGAGVSFAAIGDEYQVCGTSLMKALKRARSA